MDNEEILKKIIQSDFEAIDLDDSLTDQIMKQISALPKKEVSPLIGKNTWLKVALFSGITFFSLILIELNITILLDLPLITKKIGLFLSALKLPLIGLSSAIILALFDYLFGKKVFKTR